MDPKVNVFSKRSEEINQSNPTTFLSIQLIFLHLGGILPPECCYVTSWKMKAYNAFSVVIFLWYIPIICAELYGLYKYWSIVDDTTVMIFEIFCLASVMAATLHLILRRRKLKSIILIMRESFEICTNICRFKYKHEEILTQSAKQVKYFSMFLLLSDGSALLLWTITPFLFWCMYTEKVMSTELLDTMDINTSDQIHLEFFPLKIWLPSNATTMPMYPVIWAYEMFITQVAYFNFIAYNTMFFAITTFARAHLKVLSSLLEDINEIIEKSHNEYEVKNNLTVSETLMKDTFIHVTRKKEEDAKKIKINSHNEENILEIKDKEDEEDIENPTLYLKNCIKYHQFLLRFCNEVEDLYAPLMLMVFGMNGIMLCAAVFYGTELAEDESYMKFIVINLTCWGPLLLLCWYGETLPQQSSTVMEAASGCKWYKASTDLKKLVLILIMKAQTPVLLTAGKRIPISFRGYFKIAAYIYCLFLMIKAMKDVK